MENNKDLSEFLERTQNEFNLENITKKIFILKSELLDEMKSYGILSYVAEKILMGIEVINCSKCNSPNMYCFYFEEDIKYYKCANCNNISCK